MKILPVMPSLRTGSTMASLSLHGGLIALALLLGGQAGVQQEKVLRVSLAQMVACVQPATAAGQPEGINTQGPIKAPHEPAKQQEVQPQQPPCPVAQASDKTISPVKKKPVANKPAQQATPAKPVQTTAVSQPLQQTARAEAGSEAVGTAKPLGNADGKGTAGQGNNGAEAGGASSPNVLHKLLGAIEQYKNYPKHARRIGAEGVAILLVQVGNDGKVSGSSLHKGSGHGVLDSATEQLGARLSGLDTGVRGSSFAVRVPVEYSLR